MRRAIEGQPYFVRELTAREFIGLSEIASAAAKAETHDQITSMAKICAIGAVGEGGATFNSDPEFWLDLPFNSVVKPLAEAVIAENGLTGGDGPGE